MSAKRSWIAVCLVVAVAALTAASAQEQKAMDQKQMMNQMMKYGAVTKAHDFLKNYVGTFMVEVMSYEQPGAAPVKSTGTMTGELLFDGRFAHCRFESQMMSMPFAGVQLMGFDLFQMKYVGIWFDNMSTAFYATTGILDASGKVLTETGMWPDPMTGGTDKVRNVTTIMGPGKYRFEMFRPGPGGKEMKAMEIVYTKKM